MLFKSYFEFIFEDYPIDNLQTKIILKLEQKIIIPKQ